MVILVKTATRDGDSRDRPDSDFGGSVFLANLHHAYAQTDGTYKFPNSREGDMLKRAKQEIESLLFDESEK